MLFEQNKQQLWYSCCQISLVILNMKFNHKLGHQIWRIWCFPIQRDRSCTCIPERCFKDVHRVKWLALKGLCPYTFSSVCLFSPEAHDSFKQQHWASTCINLILSAAVCGNACHYISSPALRPESITNYTHFNYNSDCVIVLYRLRDCGVTDEGCAALASALRSNPSHLRELNLSRNKLYSGVKLLSDLRDDSHYKLETLYYCEYIII